MRTAAEVMSKFRPCSEAVEWMADRAPKDAWEQCHRGDWLLWAAELLGVDRKLLVLAACDCAETALEFVPVGEERPRRAIETARRWAAGSATLEEVIAADADAAAAADSDSDADAAYAAADAAAYAASDTAHQRMSDLVRARIPWSVVEPLLTSKEAPCSTS